LNLLLIRFPSILTTLVHDRANRDQFTRLVQERPIDVVVTTRRKRPDVDLKRGYLRRMAATSGLVFILLTMGFVGLPEIDVQQVADKKEQIVIQVDEIPETRQLHRPPPPPRPAVPIETEDENVPDDVTIESTDLDFDDVYLDLPPPPPQMAKETVDEDPIEFWAVEDKPVITKQVPPRYPEVARKAGIQGTILVRVLISKEGRVQQAEVLRGKDIFHKAALTAVKQYHFSPAKQNDRPVPVWMALPIRFRLVN
jgi:periplasmic protein TonB